MRGFRSFGCDWFRHLIHLGAGRRVLIFLFVYNAILFLCRILLLWCRPHCWPLLIHPFIIPQGSNLFTRLFLAVLLVPPVVFFLGNDVSWWFLFFPVALLHLQPSSRFIFKGSRVLLHLLNRVVFLNEFEFERQRSLVQPCRPWFFFSSPVDYSSSYFFFSKLLLWPTSALGDVRE